MHGVSSLHSTDYGGWQRLSAVEPSKNEAGRAAAVMRKQQPATDTPSVLAVGLAAHPVPTSCELLPSGVGEAQRLSSVLK